MFERLRRHPLLTLTILLFGAAGVALAVFLYTFNLNDYRSEVQSRLQSALNRPVKIGSIHFALRHGLSLDIRDAAIGNPEDATSLRVDHLLLRLRIPPLLKEQRLSFSSVLLEGAQLHLLPDAKESVVGPPEPTTQRFNFLLDLLRRSNITSLLLRNGQVTMVTEGRDYQLDNIALELKNIAFLAPIAVTGSGELSTGALRAPWEVAGKIDTASSETAWPETQIDLIVGLKGMDLAQLPSEFGRQTANFQLSGTANLTLHAQGTPAAGLTISGRAESNNLSLSLPALYATPLHAQEVVLQGVWKKDAPETTLLDLLLRLDTLTLQGKIALPTAAGEPLIATLAIPDTPLTRLASFLPQGTPPRLAATLRGKEVSGSATLEKLQLHWSPAEGVRLAHAHFYLHDARFALKEIGLVERVQGEGAWSPGILTLKGVKAALLGGSSAGAGTISFADPAEPHFDLEFTSTAKAEALTPLLPPVWQKKLHASGPLTLKGKVGGTPARLLLDLLSRFDAAAVRFNQIPLKQAGEVGELLVLGAIDASGLELSHSRLTLPFGEARANGHLALDASGGYTLACDINNLSIEKLPPFFPVQKKLQGRGEVDLRLDLSGDEQGLYSLLGSGEYRKFGVHLGGALAEVRGGKGRLLLTREGIDFPEISGLLGLSPLRGSAALKWLPEFKLTLDLDLAQTRAADLVFKSPKKTFASLRGRVIISRTEILFEKIAAEIADETTALINGRLTYAPARLDLDIAAPRANVAGIIALWQDGEKQRARATPPAASAHPLAVKITTKVTKGDLYGVSFQQASGTIAVREGKLFIEPLRLAIGPGSATVAISTGPLHADHILLRISGEAERINAARVQRQLLGRRGSITGTLESTFALQGEIGRFLPTCNGNVHVRIDNGLLRGFTSISRALAIFNVGKILSFNLPDVAKEGLLFDQIQGNLTFNNGVMRSEDLAVASPAFDMAFVGEADLAKDRLDFIIGVKPLQTVDKVLSHIPLAGWILTGEKKAFIIANFHVTGRSEDPQVDAVPFSSLSDMVVGIFKRTFGLPAKIVNDVQELFRGESPSP